MRALPPLLLCVAAVASCGFDWDSYDPRLSNSAPTAGAGGVGGRGDGGAGGSPAEPFCGDNFIDDAEQCDDGNAVDGDGCDANCVVECTGLLNTETHHCYTYIETLFDTWAGARDACALADVGSDLAAVSSTDEHAWITSQAVLVDAVMSGDPFFIGGTDQAEEDVWLWSNGEPWLAFWVSGEPNNGGGTPPVEHRAVYRRDADEIGYDDKPCQGESYGALCERAPAGAPR